MLFVELINSLVQSPTRQDVDVMHGQYVNNPKMITFYVTYFLVHMPPKKLTVDLNKLYIQIILIKCDYIVFEIHTR